MSKNYIVSLVQMIGGFTLCDQKSYNQDLTIQRKKFLLLHQRQEP